MALVNVFDLEFTEGNKISKESPMILYAIQRLRNKRKFIIEEHEQVFDLGEMLLECVEIEAEQNKKRGNKNASTRV